MPDININEALLIAIEIEKAGKEFYVRAASSVASQELRILFLEISKDEINHIELLSQVYDQSKNVCQTKPSFCSPEYLVHLIDLEPMLKNLEHMPTSIESLLKTSIDIEKSAILYYTEIKNHMPEGELHDKVEKILHEEKLHFVELSEIMKKLLEVL